MVVFGITFGTSLASAGGISRGGVSAFSKLFITPHAARVAPATSGSLEAVPAASDDDRTVLTKGGFKFVPNALISSNLRFVPGRINIKTGAMATWIHSDTSDDPHTVTIVERKDLPQNIEEFEELESNCAACAHAWEAHFPEGKDEVKVVNAGKRGLDKVGDSLLFFKGERISAKVSARAGETLYYLCIIHPWMQGSIGVTGKN
jgi:plastocyanin